MPSTVPHTPSPLLPYPLRASPFSAHPLRLSHPGGDLTISLHLFNAGPGPAYEIILHDDWPSRQFAVIRGHIKARYAEIAPQAHIVHNFTVAARSVGHIAGFPGELSYLVTASGPLLHAHTSTFESVSVVTTEEYLQRTNPAWWAYDRGEGLLVFVVTFVVAVFGPLTIYRFTRRH